MVPGLNLKKITVTCFVVAFADSLFLSIVSVILRAIGEPTATDLLDLGLGTILQILGFIGVAAFCVFVVTAFGIAIQKLPRREDDL
jgi:hypothetical protein